MKLGRWAGATDPGRRRRRNEDAYVTEPPVFAVADGMGGAQAGEVASRLAAAAVKDGSGDVEELIQEANRRVHQRSVDDPGSAGMGTTMTVAVVGDGGVRFGHVGDSRAYLVRDGKLEQLTQDHSLVGELLRSGKLSREEAGQHPQRSMITRAVGTDPDVDVDAFVVDSRPGDLFLICSDGLTDMVADTKIEQLAAEQRDDLDALVKALVRAANKGGGDDNITVVAFEIAEDGEETREELEQTAVLAADDEEDTLTEADAVPVVDTPARHDTMVVSLDDVAAASEAPAAVTPKRRGRLLRRLLSFVLALAFLTAIAIVVLWALAR